MHCLVNRDGSSDASFVKLFLLFWLSHDTIIILSSSASFSPKPIPLKETHWYIYLCEQSHWHNAFPSSCPKPLQNLNLNPTWAWPLNQGLTLRHLKSCEGQSACLHFQKKVLNFLIYLTSKFRTVDYPLEVVIFENTHFRCYYPWKKNTKWTSIHSPKPTKRML